MRWCMMVVLLYACKSGMESARKGVRWEILTVLCIRLVLADVGR